MERRAHADRCQSLPEELPDDMGRCLFFFGLGRAYSCAHCIDLMIEVSFTAVFRDCF